MVPAMSRNPFRPGAPRALLLACSLLSALACASTTTERFPEGRALVDAVVDEALVRNESWEMLQELCAVAPGRLAGSPAAQAAVEWGRDAMLAAGLENVRLEPCTVPHWERGQPEELVIVAPPELAGERLSILALGGSVATPEEGLEAEVIEVRDFEELRRRAAEAEGRFVLFNRPMDDRRRDPFGAYGGAVDQRSRGAVEAARVGAVGALVRSMTQRRDDVPHTGALRYAPDVPPVPAVALSTDAADRLSALVARPEGAATGEMGPPLRLRLRLACRTLPDAPSHNVVGELVGSERPEEVVLLGAHLDSWDVGQGAHDDGAGCVQVIEAAGLLRRLGLRPRRTVRVVLFMNEENGLAGARAYEAAHRGELGRHVLALESDRGGFTPRGFTTNANDAALSVLREAAAHLEEIGASLVLPGGGGADIGVLGPSGVVLCGYLPDAQRYFDVHHSARDVLEAVNPRELALGAAAIASLAFLVADLPQALPRNAGGG